MAKKKPSTPPKPSPASPRQRSLKTRLQEINTKTEKDIAAIYASVEKAKASFRSNKT